jgi:hypothetical protein
VKTDDGTITEEVSEIDLTGGHIKPGQIGLFPMAVTVPGKSGSVQPFKTLQTYSNGKVLRWIGTPDSDSPAPRVSVQGKDAPVSDFAETPPPGSVHTNQAASAPAAADPATDEGSDGSDGNGLAIAALIIAVLGTALAGVALLTRRRPATT